MGLIPDFTSLNPGYTSLLTDGSRCAFTLRSIAQMWMEITARWKACASCVRDAAMKSKLPERRVHRRRGASMLREECPKGESNFYDVEYWE
jgi:hypothetical protein